jgi:hypothetical protein
MSRPAFAVPRLPSLLSRLGVLLGCAALLGVHVEQPAARAAAPADLRDLGVMVSTAHDPFVEGDLVAFAVSEQQAGRDYSGDGQLDDAVLGTYDLGTGRVRITEHPARAATYRWVCRSGELLAFITEEDGQHDHNQDGDTGDAALALLDLGSYAITVEPISAGAGVACSDGHVVYTANERDWNQGRVLNGDGDIDDDVWAIYSLADGSSYVLEFGPVAAIHASAKLDEDRFLFTVDEPTNAFDFNFDGDQQDIVTMSYDYVSRAIRNYEQAAYLLPDERDHATRAAGRFVPLIGLEAEQGVGKDLNDDGDTLDKVVLVVDTRTGDMKSTERAGYALRSATDWMTLFVDEAAQDDTDLTGDGDTSDHVLVFYNPQTGQEWNTGLAVTGTPSVGPRFHSDFGAGAYDGLVAVEISEAGSGVDLNGNGWVGDRLVQVFHPAQRRITATEARSVCMFSHAELLVLGARYALTCDRESSYPPRDLNGDGDTLDWVTGLLPLDRRVAESMGVAMDLTSRPMLLAGGGAFVASESGQGQDLNGDGDVSDRVLHLLRTDNGRAINAGFAVARKSGPGSPRFVWAASDDLLVVAGDEYRDGHDHNGDGDLDDHPLYFWRP